LLYLDGDADLRTPQTTIPGNFDGMVIAALLGEGDPWYTGLACVFHAGRATRA
jgi:hypothetical protein